MVLVPSLLFTRAITKSDINNIRAMVGGIGVFSGLINRLLSLIEKIMNAFKIRNN